MLHEAGSRDLVGELEHGVLDIALVILPMHHDILETTPLLREELVLAVPKSHALAKRRSVSIVDLRGVDKASASELIRRDEGERIFITDAVMTNVSATDIRRAVRENSSELTGIVPVPVADYIRKYQLYRDTNGR